MLTELRSKLNRKYRDEYENSLVWCQKILLATKQRKDQFENFFQETALKYKLACQLIEDFSNDFYLKFEESELRNLNRVFFAGIDQDSYEDSIFNPEFAVKVFGKEMGRIIFVAANMYQPLYHKAVEGQFFEITPLGTMLHELYVADRQPEVWQSIIKTTKLRLDPEVAEYQQLKAFSPEFTPFLEIVENADLNDLRYLYQYLNYLHPNEIETASFLNDYPRHKTDQVARTLVDAFIRGFELAGKDYKKKKFVNIMYNMGQERIIRAALPLLREKGLVPVINHVFYTKPNQQFSFDHRFDNVIFMDEQYNDLNKKILASSLEKTKDCLMKMAGNIYFDRFGEKLFSPVQKPESLKPDASQQKLMKELAIYRNQLYNQYIPREETSFCIIGFPVPEIGNRFPEIFENTLKINMLDSKKWESLQQFIIDILDKADFVEVKGKGDNLTDIRVQMQNLEKPDKQTNFCNCSADVNIPVGEVFTSPQLMGTNGILHITDIYLDDLNYKDLKLTFKDGFAVDYSCANYDDDDKNRNLVYESLFLPYDKLPLGEFAIGTNTHAYLMAKKYGILPKMPILIIEKMGPHFAIGDTCYSWEEDRPVFNPDGKEIMSRDNEVSILRKTDMNQAYTNKHTDITLPYEELGRITAVTLSGKRIDIIRDGRFVVPGTEVLNQPLEELDKLL